MSLRSVVCLVALCVLLSACGKNYTRRLPEGQRALRKITDPRRIPDFRPAYGDRAGLENAIAQSLFYLEHPSSEHYFPYLEITHDRAVRSLESFKALLNTAASPDDLQRQIVNQFDVYESVGCDDRGTVLFTGYCTPIYRASLKPTDEYRYPLYKLPDDLVKGEKGEVIGRKTSTGIVPYFTRRELESSRRLAGLELVYLRDRLEAYLVHVQGSAKLELPDGSTFEVGYAGTNGHEYKSLREMLINDRKLRAEKASLIGIKEYFRQHPEDLDVYLPRNDRFVFFQQTAGGPFGSLGVPVTAMRSIATDKTGSKEIYPRSCLAFIQTKLPRMTDRGTVDKASYSGFILDQDTGGAIRSAGRADVYMGVGPIAERLAGHTVAEGKIYYIFVKEALLQPPRSAM
ncbi:MAG TPA: MltA domain-containing protein [Planctomycetota bacterium]|nr:MltA domain-containing protein [Planctomycetota bacterium]